MNEPQPEPLAPLRTGARPYVVRPYAVGDEQGILTLFHRAFGTGDGRLPCRNLAWWRWEFAANPAGAQIMLALDPETDTVIAQYAALSVRFSVEGRDEILTQPVDSMVDPLWRGTGVFLAVAKRYFEVFGNARHCLASYGFPNTRARELGRRQLEYVPTFAPITTLHANLFAGGGCRPLGAAGRTLDRTEVSRFGPEVDALWAEVRDAYPFAIARDAAYLNWRFADAPVPHRLFLLTDRSSGTLRAAFVLRERWCADSIVALADYVAAPDDAATLHATLAAAVQEARGRGFGRVETWLPPRSRLFDGARRLGFESEAAPSAMVARFYRPHAPLQWYLDNWYYTIGDSDVL